MTPLPFFDSSKGHTQAIQRASLSLKPSFFPANMLENLDLSSLVEGLVLIWNNGGGGRHLAKMYGRSRRNQIPVTASPVKQQEDTDND